MVCHAQFGVGTDNYSFPCPVCTVQGDIMLLPRLGEGRDGECPVRAVYCVILNSGAERNVIQNPLQLLPMRHTGLDPVSPTSSEGFKLFRPFQSVKLCHSGSQPGMTKEMTVPHPNPPRVGEGILQIPFPKLRGNRQNAPSPDWGRLGWGVSRKGLVLSSLCARFGVSCEFIGFNYSVIRCQLI